MNFNYLLIPTVVFSVCLFFLGLNLARSSESRKQKIWLLCISFCLSIPGLLFSIYYLHLFDSSIAFYNFRAIPFIELTAIGLGLFGGVFSGVLIPAKSIFRLILIACLIFFISIPYLKPILAPLGSSSFSDRWNDNVCLQSTPSSCGAASSATIFRYFGDDISEKTIAKEAYTYRGGTENWYLARAFRQRGYLVNFRVEAGMPSGLEFPCIAGVRINGIGHFITILDEVGGRFITGDPLVGRQEFSAWHLDKAFEFTGFFMEIKKPISMKVE